MRVLKSDPDTIAVDQPNLPDPHVEEVEDQFVRGRYLSKLRLLWNERRFIVRCGIAGLLVSTLIAFVIPKEFVSTVQLMPPDTQSSSSLALLAGLSGPGGLGMLAGDLLGVKSTGALFIGVLRSRTVEDRIVNRFNLKKVYGMSLDEKTCAKLAERTSISEDRKSGIIAITVTDRDPKRVAAMASSYVEELDTIIAQLSTSSARRERIFLEDRLSGVKRDLDVAEKDFSQFASSKGAIDIPEQGKAMVGAAATLEGQLIAAQSELEGLKQSYTDNNIRVKSTKARIDELRQQLRKIGGKASGASESTEDPDAPYPTLRQLPILGVPYADKLRTLKVQEAVFETLTKEYELAKVQEAKEVPSVTELDAPVVPERKSFPPRMEIISFGVFCAILAGLLWLWGAARWNEIDPQDPGKILAQEVFHTFVARVPWTSRNGASETAAEAEAKHTDEDRPSAKGASAGSSG
jgi:capsule polysaccharide export protein KpsE/RkpR